MMGTKEAPTVKGRESANEYRQRTKAEERKVEAEKGSHLKKGAERFDERSRSSDGQGAGAKQRD